MAGGARCPRCGSRHHERVVAPREGRGVSQVCRLGEGEDEGYADLYARVDALPPLSEDECRAIGELLTQVRRPRG